MPPVEVVVDELPVAEFGLPGRKRTAAVRKYRKAGGHGYSGGDGRVEIT